MILCSKCGIRSNLGKCIMCKKDVCWQCADEPQFELRDDFRGIILYFKHFDIRDNHCLNAKIAIKPIILCHSCHDKLKNVSQQEEKELLIIFFESIISHDFFKKL